jgi:glutamate synthase (NADPH/NADH) small chain
VLLTGGAEQSRDLPVPGRDLDGVHFAMEFLPQQNKVVPATRSRARSWPDGKHVIVIGGGDTGSDCVGTSNRHGAASVTQFELMPHAARAGEQAADLAVLADKLRTSPATKRAASASSPSPPRSSSAARARSRGRPEDRARASGRAAR